MITPVVRIFQNDIIPAVKADVLATIQANQLAAENARRAADDKPALTESRIKTINYLPAYIQEVMLTIEQNEQSDNYADKNYPLVMLVEDQEVHGSNGYAGDWSGTIAICWPTEKDYKWDDRYTMSFEPVLYPIYESLIEQIWRHPMFVIPGGWEGVKFLKADKPYWGAGAFKDGEGNVFKDPVDTLLISNLKFSLNNKSTN
ncbi:hypothetical protein UFOVP74_43 [uncultured Caudovirales phage]|uniref:Uncharacterized protein n=1 Tax=uncultured Caudovirales phage TaxID=2100421 RepID=A0A6J5L387_9CAUD|nr:hypothetical protein UFOVP74_43 [uncultured Caudovirales phage]